VYVLTTHIEYQVDKFNDIGFQTWKLSKQTKALRDDLVVVLMTHVDTEEDEMGAPRVRAKTLGKLINKIVTLEGLFTSVILSKAINTSSNGVVYKFLVKNDGASTVKTPMGMFDDVMDEGGFIDNDLELVRNTIINYYK